MLAVTPGRVREALVRRWEMARHRGDAVVCPVCGHRFSAFKDAWNRPRALCWRCGSAERHRALWLYLERHPDLLEAAGSLLHFAPEWCLEQRFRRVPDLRYVTTDLEPGKGELQLDITRLALPDGAFDAVICSHVLEHVEDDAAAIGELYRVVAPGGWAIVMVPLDLSLNRTYEQPLFRTPEQRLNAFWQHDHVRLYAVDIVDRLRLPGFQVATERLAAELGPAPAARYGLLESDLIFVCRRT
ncbi:MAG TPA: class I SAM-dependent methyltransferase [Solirubrobacteraceae bacterium]|jgi:SAM-dependent methyltransferase